MATVRLILIGNAEVGKTSLICKYAHNNFTRRYRPSTGCDFSSCCVRVEDSVVNVQMWDTAGSEKREKLGPVFYQNSHCCLIVFDVNDRDSFEAAVYWRLLFLKTAWNCSPRPPIVLVGTKSDACLRRREVSLIEAIELASDWGVSYHETSSRIGDGIVAVFSSSIVLGYEYARDTGTLTWTEEPPDDCLWCCV